MPNPNEAQIDPQVLMAEYQNFTAFVAESAELREKREAVRGRIGPSPRDVLYREHSVTVYRYRRSTPAKVKTPLLVIPSLVNKPFIMDMLEGESFVSAMLQRGFDVFMIEWGEPTPAQRFYKLDRYVNGYLARAARRVARAAGAPAASLAGICLGGCLALLLAACDKGKHVRNLVTMVTPANFEDRGILSFWAKEEHFNIDKIVDTYGNIPADFFSSAFPWIVPTASLTKARTFYDRHKDAKFMESFLALDIWATENTPFPGEVYREIIKKGYQQNVLAKTREWDLGDRVARLQDLRMPVLNLCAQYDHISPVESCTVLGELVGSRDVTNKTYPAGHLGFALGKDITGKQTPEYWDEIAAWLKKRD